MKVLLVSVATGTMLLALHVTFGAVRSGTPISWPIYVLVFFAGALLASSLVYVGYRLKERIVLEKARELADCKAQLDVSKRRISELLDERRISEQKQKSSSKLEALGRLAGGIAHDVNNVLASIMSIASTMKLDMDMTNFKVPAEDVNDILDACRSGRDLTLSLLGFVRKGDFLKRPISLVKEIEDIRKLLLRVSPKSLSIVLDFEQEVPQIEGDPSEIKNVLMNLCINGIDAMAGDGELTVALKREQLSTPTPDLPAGSYVLLRVTDTGEGMSEETLRRAFEPFYTTKPEGKGTGLGLPRVWNIVQQHGGTVEIDSYSGVGTTFNVMFPALDEAREKGWTIIDMKKDWKYVYPFTLP